MSEDYKLSDVHLSYHEVPEITKFLKLRSS